VTNAGSREREMIECGGIVWSPKTKVIISGGKRLVFSSLMLEYDFSLIK